MSDVEDLSMMRWDKIRWMVFLTLAMLIYSVLFSVLSVLRYNTFHATTLDLGIMAQVTWNTAHGRWFETSIGRAANGALIGSYLGNHVRPILLLLAPLYRLWPDPRLLLILQSVGLGIAALPLYAIAHRKMRNPRVAFLVAICYLLYPALGFLNLTDFHPIAFTIPLIYLAYWALEDKRLVLFWAASALALFAKEEMVAPIGAWGIVNLLRRDRRRVGWGLVSLAMVWAILCFVVVIPYFNEGRSYRFFQLWSQLTGLLGETAFQGSTIEPIGRASGETVALFLIHLFLPLGLLPFLGPAAFVVALPSFAYLLLGKRPAFHSVGYQYPAVLIPWFFLAVVEGMHWAHHRKGWWGRGRLYRLGLAFMLLGTLAIQIPLNPILLYAQAGMFRPDSRFARLREALTYIPPDAGVTTINQLGPPLVNRRVFVPLEYPSPFRLDHVLMADYVLVDLVDCRFVPTPNPRQGYADIIDQILETDRFRVRYWSGRILLLEKGETVEEESILVQEYVADMVEQGRDCWP